MVWSDEGGPVHHASGMPVKIVQRAQYMNDAVGSVCGKLTQAINYKKSAEFSGGIWDCKPVKKTVTSEPSCMDTSNNSEIKIFSLEEMLESDDEYATYDDTIMKENDDLIRNQNKVAEFSVTASHTDVSIDVKNKRWRSEEFDKTSLLPCNDCETTRKKSKKNVSFSDVVVDLEDSSKSAGKISKFVALDVTAVRENIDGLKERDIVEENEGIKNSVLLVSNSVNDIPIKMEDKVNALPKKSVFKESKKVKNWTKLMSQSCKIDSELLPVKVESLNKLSCEKHRTAKSDEMVTENIVNNRELKNEELMNRSRLEIAIPELFQYNESKTEDEADPRLVKKNLKDKLKCATDDLINIQNLELEIKTSQSSKKYSPVKNSHSDIELNSSKNEIKSKTFEKNSVSNEIQDRLKNSLLEMFDDSDIAESLTIRIKELAEQKKRITHVTEKEKIMSDDKQTGCVSMLKHEKLLEEKSVKEQTCNGSKFLSKDESQYKTKNYPILQEKKDCCPPVCDRPSCNQESFVKMEEDLMKDKEMKESISKIDYKSGKISLTSYEPQKNFNYTASHSRSDLCSNWRSQCIDNRLKDTQENIIPQSSSTVNCENDYSSLRSQPNDPSRPNFRKTRRFQNSKKQHTDNIDVSSKTESVGNDMVVVPIYLKEPPEPLSRFKDINTDPESIWDSCVPNQSPSRINNTIQTQIDYFDLKNGSEVEEVHARSYSKSKIASVPRFFDDPKRTFIQTKSHGEICEDVKLSSPKKIGSTTSGMLNENYRSRSQSRQENFIPHRSYERNRSSSAQWRSSLAATSLEHDVYYIVKIKSLQDDTIEKLRILKEDFLCEVRENSKLSDIIPSPCHRLRKIAYSISAVKMFIRCIFSLSYEIPSWITALEAFALAKKFGVNNLKKECEDYFTNYKIPSEEIQQVAACAQQLQAVDALKSSKFFQKVQNFKSSSAQNKYTPQSCTVSCSVLVDSSEFVIPLTYAAHRGLESCNESDVRNRVSFTSLAPVTLLSGIQLKFLTEDGPHLKIFCEVYQTKKGGNAEKLFYKEHDTRAKSSVKIPFEDEITVKYSEEIEILVYIEDVLLKICPQLTKNKIDSPGKFCAKFESSKTSESNRRLFCIEKMFYTQA
ncbi:unnamed protein product [Larinioides sclopetarius]|uniref:Uncharacterized protein n=1 Tax=Larinioides sclopetarius TaxID=280406 RepID=A0AAV1YZ59_9ARAC